MVIVDTPAGNDDTLLDIVSEEPQVAELYEWAVQPDCGAVVLFTGTARDHSQGRPDVSLLSYEAYEEYLLESFAALTEDIRARWPEVRRVGMVHRVGEVPIGETIVVIIVSCPHRDDAFEAARHGIDRLKAVAPIWKREVWRDGESWGLDARKIEEVESNATSRFQAPERIDANSEEAGS